VKFTSDYHLFKVHGHWFVKLLPLAFCVCTLYVWQLPMGPM